MDLVKSVILYAQKNAVVAESLAVIERAFTGYDLTNTCISFNGGKDSTVVMYLVLAAVTKNAEIANNNKEPVIAFYAHLPDCFEEETVFVRETVKRHNLKLMEYQTNSIKDSLWQMKRDNPEITAVFIGSRHADHPNRPPMLALAPTDISWPPLMRVNPILNWNYSDIWNFIKDLHLPYCDLYNKGYSSFGTQSNTQKNKKLLRVAPDGTEYFVPAWHLTDSKDERCNRD